MTFLRLQPINQKNQIVRSLHMLLSVAQGPADTPLKKGMQETYRWIETQYLDRKADNPTVS